MPTSPSPDRLINMASAYYDSCVLLAAADLGIFTCLAQSGEAASADVASALGLDERATRLLLNACVALELLTKRGEIYANTPEATAFLVQGSPGDLTQALRYNRDVYPAWGGLPNLLRTGKPVEAPALHLGRDEARTRSFVMAMHGRALAIGRAVVPQLDLRKARRVLDLGGGSGAYAILVAQACPEVECVVLDLPAIVKVAADLIRAAGLQNRITCVAGDYHVDPLPNGFDAIHIFGVLHQESPSSIQDVLNRCLASLTPGGTIHVMDMMTDETHCRPKFSALFAVNMALTAEQGWVFSSKDLQGWMAAAGFEDYACAPLPPPMPHWLATARKPIRARRS